MPADAAPGDVVSAAASVEPVPPAADIKGSDAAGVADRDTYKAMVGALVQADLAGTSCDSFLTAFHAASDPEKGRLLLGLVDAFGDDKVTDWIDASPDRVAAALRISTTVTPPDAAAGHNDKAEARIAAIRDWSRWPYQMIVVPGYTPLQTHEAKPGIHPIAKDRLEEAVEAFNEGKAPFIMVSGGNVHPDGTPYYEGLEMKQVLLEMGVPEEAIIVDAKARHSTTNLRNAGRFMQGHGMTRALITPPGGGLGGTRLFDQTFYFSHPDLSTFSRRCRRELGYGLGDLHRAGPGRVSFQPTDDVQRQNYRDPLDP
ncbi:MAG: YdcF family protein [Candidatus Sericytochromatia bacterium]|nr:YdcF family protein [Candidatus Sericytochromatia bacterium]